MLHVELVVISWEGSFNSVAFTMLLAATVTGYNCVGGLKCTEEGVLC